MTKEEIAAVLEKIATLLELKDENPFKIRAYTNAARAIETFGGNIPNFQDEEAVAKIPGIGKSIALKINELAATGSLKYFEELSAEFPVGILELFSLPGLGAKKIKALYDRLGINSIEQLQKACEDGRVAELPGFGQTTQQKLCESIAKRAAHAGSFQFGQVAAEAETLRSDLAAHPTRLCRLILPEAIGAERKSCTISISLWRQKNPKRSRSSLFRIRSSNRSSLKDRRNRVCDFVPECSAICE